MSTDFIPKHTQQTLEEIGKNASEILSQHKMYLGGGTALAFHLKYRISYDLDFFTKLDFEPQELLTAFSTILAPTSVQTSPGTLKFIHNQTSISFFHYPYKVLNAFTKQNNVNVASILDIALMKITAIADRGMKKDFFDLYYSAQYLGGLNNILNKFEEKFPEANFQHYLKALVYFLETEKTPSPDLLKTVATWQDVKDFFIQSVREYMQNQAK